ncbi:hypothetical protein CEXT_774051 [Caerostris extrusa]|uniref:Uncharacterized protein n=1 Tax=Caerostris extrusa TaxID=172846 RepID=A0AAV4NJE0_CAEEX|nr:hypothetical protein CEXT_774051 [Caerostris extrusa]
MYLIAFLNSVPFEWQFEIRTPIAPRVQIDIYSDHPHNQKGGLEGAFHELAGLMINTAEVSNKRSSIVNQEEWDIIPLSEPEMGIINLGRAPMSHIPPLEVFVRTCSGVSVGVEQHSPC